MGNRNIKFMQESPSEKVPLVAAKTTISESGKRHFKDMKKDYEKLKKEFMEKSTQQIQELLAKLSQCKTEQEKIQINNTIDLIKKEMENYSKQKKLAPPKKEKIIAPPVPHNKPNYPNKKYEAGLEEITKELQNYIALIAKLKVIIHLHIDCDTY